jgi:hypothetical protein
MQKEQDPDFLGFDILLLNLRATFCIIFSLQKVAFSLKVLAALPEISFN